MPSRDDGQQPPTSDRRAVVRSALLGEQGDAERSSAINAAFVVLTDKGARAKHDAMLRSSGAPAATIMCAPLPTPPPPPGGRARVRPGACTMVPKPLCNVHKRLPSGYRFQKPEALTQLH